jgi:hypothetical protein
MVKGLVRAAKLFDESHCDNGCMEVCTFMKYHFLCKQVKAFPYNGFLQVSQYYAVMVSIRSGIMVQKLKKDNPCAS